LWRARPKAACATPRRPSTSDRLRRNAVTAKTWRPCSASWARPALRRLTAVADEDGPAAFELAGRAVEAGYELRLLCRELSRLVRDLLVLSVDESRFRDPDIAPEADHERLRA